MPAHSSPAGQGARRINCVLRLQRGSLGRWPDRPATEPGRSPSRWRERHRHVVQRGTPCPVPYLQFGQHADVGDISRMVLWRCRILKRSDAARCSGQAAEDGRAGSYRNFRRVAVRGGYQADRESRCAVRRFKSSRPDQIENALPERLWEGVFVPDVATDVATRPDVAIGAGEGRVHLPRGLGQQLRARHDCRHRSWWKAGCAPGSP